MLATKLFAPARRSQAVARTRLAAQLDATLEPGHRLTLVSAPAGFGKTTVLSDWVAGVGERDPAAHTAWLSLDDADNDLTRLLTHLVASLGTAGVDLEAATVLDPLPGDVTVALTALVNALARAGEQEPGGHWVLVVDDYHVIIAPEVHEAMAFLLDHAPGQLHLMIATRADPPLPVARLRSRGQLVEVRGADLRFTPDEAQQFLTQAMGLDLDARRHRCPRGAHRGLDRGAPARRAVVAGHPDQARGHRLHRRVHRQQPVRHRLPGRRGPGPPTGRGARLPAAHRGARPAHGTAV